MAQGDLTKLEGRLHTAATSARRRSRPARYGRTEWPCGDTYLSEFFRTSLRGTGFGIMVGGGRLVSILAPILVSWGIATYGPTGPFLATASLWVLTIFAYYTPSA